MEGEWSPLKPFQHLGYIPLRPLFLQCYYLFFLWFPFHFLSTYLHPLLLPFASSCGFSLAYPICLGQKGCCCMVLSELLLVSGWHVWSVAVDVVGMPWSVRRLVEVSTSGNLVVGPWRNCSSRSPPMCPVELRSCSSSSCGLSFLCIRWSPCRPFVPHLPSWLYWCLFQILLLSYILIRNVHCTILNKKRLLLLVVVVL
jgi:hypothetical protein